MTMERRWLSDSRSRAASGIGGLVLYEPTLFSLLLADPRSRDAAMDIAVLRIVLRRYLDAGDWFRAALRYLDHWSGRDAWERLSTPQRAAMAWRMPELYARLDATLADPTHPSVYAAIDIPVLLLSGSRTRASTGRIAQLLARTLPRAEWHKVDGAGLRGIDSHPEAVEREIADFLVCIPSRPPPSRCRHLRTATAEPATGSGRETDRTSERAAPIHPQTAYLSLEENDHVEASQCH